MAQMASTASVPASARAGVAAVRVLLLGVVITLAGLFLLATALSGAAGLSLPASLRRQDPSRDHSDLSGAPIGPCHADAHSPGGISAGQRSAPRPGTKRLARSGCGRWAARALSRGQREVVLLFLGEVQA